MSLNVLTYFKGEIQGLVHNGTYATETKYHPSSIERNRPSQSTVTPCQPLRASIKTANSRGSHVARVKCATLRIIELLEGERKPQPG